MLPPMPILILKRGFFFLVIVGNMHFHLLVTVTVLGSVGKLPATGPAGEMTGASQTAICPPPLRPEQYCVAAAGTGGGTSLTEQDAPVATAMPPFAVVAVVTVTLVGVVGVVQFVLITNAVAGIAGAPTGPCTVFVIVNNHGWTKGALHFHLLVTVTLCIAVLAVNVVDGENVAGSHDA
jgi:hypothetical protein